MLSKSQIIVLHTIKHGDSGLVVQCYSDTVGKQALYFRGASRKGSNYALIHRLNILDVVVYRSGNGSMGTLKEITPAGSFPNIRTDIYKNTIAIFISELLVRSIREEELNPPLYSFLKAAIGVLEHLNEGTANFHIHFMVHLSKMLGFKPLDNFSEQTPLFSIPAACFTEAYLTFNGQQCLIDENRSNSHFKHTESQLLHTLLNTPFTEVGTIRCNGEMRLAFAKQMITYLSHHLGIGIEIKSLDVLHEVFS